MKSWQDPAWDKYAGNQNGTFPYSRNSTALAVDYLAGELRGCYEGWETWLKTGHSGYGAGHLWGCVGAWYSGDWMSTAARQYIGLVRTSMRRRPWRWRSFRTGQFKCDPVKGCPI